MPVKNMQSGSHIQHTVAPTSSGSRKRRTERCGITAARYSALRLCSIGTRTALGITTFERPRSGPGLASICRITGCTVTKEIAMLPRGTLGFSDLYAAHFVSTGGSAST